MDFNYPEVVKLHPIAVHFGVALPVLLLLLEVGYILNRKEPDNLEMGTLVLTFLGVSGAYITGLVAHESLEDLPITPEALGLLHTHERLGLILFALFLTVFLIRLLYRALPIILLRYLYVLVVLVGVGLLLYQGYLGGTLVYDFGVGVRP